MRINFYGAKLASINENNLDYSLGISKLISFNNMAKRANPFVEDFVQQSKVHVGLKQFNNNEDRLKKVYEKTLELLFKGAKKSTQDVPALSDNLNKQSKDKMKQLCIGKNGLISHSEVAVVKPLVNQLDCDHKQTDNRCAYCERALCVSCLHACLRCQNTYCSQCSLIGSEGAEVCVSCYG